MFDSGVCLAFNKRNELNLKIKGQTTKSAFKPEQNVSHYCSLVYGCLVETDLKVGGGGR